MARPVSPDHENKSRAILKAAAKLFASQGFDRTSINEIATECGVSKALVYHYYANKDQLLFEIIRAHLADLVAAVEVPAGLPARERLGQMITGLLEAYRHADEEHQIQISDMKRLPEEMKAELIALERALVKAFSSALAALQPGLAARADLLKPVTMNLFGMMNWKFMWFRENGRVSHADYAALVLDMVEAGAAQVARTVTRDGVSRPRIAKL
jgi:TetR/AcrR family transcriptional regulator